ncbi:hypothetical protein [Acidilutibacter cellobiosedens]|jgi:hypothetical protein|uniref:hypothetical protein n=1 Tax=Acidilutibacter cellobiosedens TaxID=2507161 RepID=UPI0014773BC5|nr:hypothetical protein [Acidilutibacter cellobiosedens]
MLKIKKIENKIEVKDVAGQNDPCKYYWEDEGKKGKYDCLVDCYDHSAPYGSDLY